MGKVLAICISEKKGTLKNEINEAKFIEDFGIENDAHAGKWHRQVSLLEFNKIDEFCHDKCQIYYQVGECIMPKNGIFTKVLNGGNVKVGDECSLDLDI